MLLANHQGLGEPGVLTRTAYSLRRLEDRQGYVKEVEDDSPQGYSHQCNSCRPLGGITTIEGGSNPNRGDHIYITSIHLRDKPPSLWITAEIHNLHLAKSRYAALAHSLSRVRPPLRYTPLVRPP